MTGNKKDTARLRGGQGPIIAHEGTPVGKEEMHNGVNMYISQSNLTLNGTRPKSAVLYLTDVFGIQLLENKLLADSFARAGYLTIAPDLFNSTPASADRPLGSNFTASHGPEATDPLLAATIDYMRNTLGIKKIGATGYCFGGRYAFRLLGVTGPSGSGRGVDAAFAAHPSLWQDDEVLAIKGPVSIGEAESDSANPPAKRALIEGLLKNASAKYQVSLYSGTSHGFGVRANISDPMQKWGKESAFWQAVSWFDYWLA
ncbi:alpha/beta-hydrolase [Thozetella sp. PMI_491]|nr:alpha/beta-hydrolase [Thozetella sp. PMI_491]